MVTYQRKAKNYILDVVERGREARDLLCSLVDNITLQLQALEASPNKEEKREEKADTATIQANIRLPTLELPQFNGNPLKWPEFWARFYAEVGGQPIPEVTKLNYLLNCLVGPAKTAASGYSIVPMNYAVVSEMLKQRYGDENLIKKHLQSELKHLSMTHSKNLRPMVEKLEVILRQLETFGDNINHPQIELAIEEKLPKWLLLDVYSKKVNDPNWNVQKLRDYIEEAVTLREMVDRYHGYNEATNTNRTNPREAIQHEKGNSALTTFANEKKSMIRKNPCVFCNGDHWNDECKRYQTYNERWEKVKQLDLCYNCLVSGHLTKECRRRVQCFHCKRQHNSALCKQTFSDERERNNRPMQIEKNRRINAASSQKTSASENVTSVTAVSSTKKEATTVLLLCREIMVKKGPYSNKTVSATVLFDTGSQKSFITNELAQRIGLKCSEKKEDIEIMGFGEGNPKRYKSKTSQLEVVLQDGNSTTIEVNSVPFLTQKLRTTEITEEDARRWRAHYQTIISPKGTWQHPQILIGADHFYDFILPVNTRRLSSGFQMVNSTVGWMLTGKGIMKEKHRNKQFLVQPLIVNTVGMKKIDDDIDNYWRLELIGIKEEETEETSDDILIQQEQPNGPSQLLDPKRFSKWSKLIRVAAYVRRIADKMKSKRDFPENLSPEEIEEAEKMVIRQAQEEKIDDSEKKKWSLILEEDIWKCQGRMQNIEGPLPIYLPKDSRFTHLYIKHIHENNGHSGVSHTLSQLWKTTWVPKGRRTVAKIIKDCYGCKRWQAKPFKLPEMPSHPGIRVRQSQPFQSIGLDYLGPITIKKGVEPIKRWIALFTCLTTRAVHLEVVHDLSAESFMQTFRRYIARRGKPETILSDNAAQFKLASKLFNELNNLQTIRWKFITERAPWQGGLYERLIGLTKQTMKKAIGRRLLDEEELRTLVTDAEGIINSRPITQVADDSNEVLRPIDFLIPQIQINVLSDEEDTEEEYLVSQSSTKDKLKKRWQQTKVVINKFWEIWRINYLAILRSRTRKEHKGPRSTTSRPPRLNEIVLVAEENVPRGNWLLGRIKEIRSGAGDVIRTALVQMPNGNIWTRPINHLCPLETDIESPEDNPNPPPNTDNDDPITHPQNDPNLDEEEDEIQENSSQIKHDSHNRNTKDNPKAAKTVNMAIMKSPVGKFWPIFLLLTAMSQMTIASMKAGHDCDSSEHGVFMRLPEIRNCSAIGREHNFVEKLVVSVYSRVPIKIPAGACSKITRTVCTKTLLRWWLEVTKDETIMEPMKLNDCLEMEQNKRFNGVILEAIGKSKWESQNPTDYNYGWFGTTCYPTVNYQIEKGFIVGGEDSHLYSDFGEMTGCIIRSNNCTTERRTIWWNVSSIQEQCPYEKIGTYNALKKGSHILIKEIQASLVMTLSEKNDTKACKFDEPKFMENDIVLTLMPTNLSLKSKRSIYENFTEEAVPLTTVVEETELLSEDVDPENVKFQFVVDELQDEIKSQVNAALKENCATRNMVIEIVKFISHNNATTAAKILLQRNDVRARVAHQGLWISPCKRNETDIDENAIVFKAGVISHYNQKKVDMALKMISEENWIAIRTKMKKEDPDQVNIEGVIEKETEQLIDRITEDFNIASRGIQKIVEEISEPWVLISICIVVIIALILSPMICFQCNICRILCKLCLARKAKKKRITKRRHNRSDLEELSQIDEEAIELQEISKQPTSINSYKKLEFKPMDLML
ncbi:unnamed protein product [Anisakis simplex]|uniref:Integrase catalytic domain-containing protein n=1 Tax=Anisakis simplex TaxID=6269 RepID=A0A0M3IYY6_ANISI|nr:unnamed protein product [Anisakis simplex]